VFGYDEASLGHRAYSLSALIMHTYMGKKKGGEKEEYVSVLTP